MEHSLLKNDIVISSRIRLARNIEDFPLPHLLKTKYPQEADAFIRKVAAVLGKDYTTVLIHRLSDVMRIALVEQHLISPDVAKQPSCDAVVLNAERDISVMLNEEDHIRSQCIMDGLMLNTAYIRLNEIDDVFIRNFSLAFDDKYGFLTGCLTNLGTGMRASVMLFLPALDMEGAIAPLFAKLNQRGITVRGTYGEGSGVTSYLYQLSNTHSLGMTERQIIKLVEEAVDHTVLAEQNARKQLMHRDMAALKTKIQDSRKTAVTADSLTLNEFIALFAVIKLGVGLGYINVKDIAEFNKLIDRAQPCTLKNSANAINVDIDKLGIDRFRAIAVRKWLTDMTLNGDR